MLSVIMMNVAMLSVVILNVVMLSVVMLSVVAPNFVHKKEMKWHKTKTKIEIMLVQRVSFKTAGYHLRL
jgi:hypothetical protein